MSVGAGSIKRAAAKSKAAEAKTAEGKTTEGKTEVVKAGVIANPSEEMKAVEAVEAGNLPEDMETATVRLSKEAGAVTIDVSEEKQKTAAQKKTAPKKPASSKKSDEITKEPAIAKKPATVKKSDIFVEPKVSAAAESACHLTEDLPIHLL